MTPSAPGPPRWAAAIVRRLSLFEGLFAVSDDFESEFARRLETEGRRRARLWAGACALRSALSYIPTAFRWSLIMYAHQLKIAWRNLKRHLGYSFINIAGLALGVAAGLFVLIYVGDELGYDRFHAKADRTYRIAQNLHVDDRIDSAVPGPAILAPTLRREFPEIESVARLRHAGNSIVRDGNRVIGSADIHAADPGFFDVFSFRLASGDPRTALAEPGSIVLSRSAAATCFGNADPMGRVLTIARQPFKVTGLMENVPRRSHVHIEYLTSDVSYPQGLSTKWFEGFCATYLVLKKGADRKAFEAKLPGFALTHFFGGRKGTSFFKDWVFFLQPLTSIHLHSHLFIGELEANGNYDSVILFLVIAVFVLLIAAVNFVNLSTARSSLRSREVAIRKVIGSERSRLVRQFLGESVLQSALAVALAGGIMAAAMPAFRSLSGKEILVRSLVGGPALLVGLALALVIGLGAGIYPALLLSSFRPASVLKAGGGAGAGIRSSTLRRVLTVMQFAVSVFLLIGTAVVARQMDYVRSKRLGFDREHVIVVKDANLLGRQGSAFKEALLRNPGIQAVAAATNLPGESARFSQGVCDPEGGRQDILVSEAWGDPDLGTVLGLEMAAGRYYSESFPSDDRGIVVNEELVRALGWTEPIGKKIRHDRRDLTVIGVVRDFHPGSLHDPIPRLILVPLEPGEAARYFAVRIGPGDPGPVLSFIKSAWSSFSPPLPLNYSFLDDDYNRLYAVETQTGKVVTIFSGLAVAIACLGLFGLAAFLTDLRKKEVGIRKVLGARVTEVVGLLAKDFLLWVAVANLIAWPAAYLVTGQWLKRFAYRIDIGFGPFFVALVLSLAASAVAVCLQTVKAALADPVNTLRNE